MSNRNTQFQGFAKALTDELVKYLTSRGGLTLDEIEQEWNKVIARRSYDLAFHVIKTTTLGGDPREIIRSATDLTELPKEQDEAEIARQKEIAEILSHGSELDAMELHDKLCNVGLPKEQEG